MKIRVTGYNKIRVTGLPKAAFGQQVNGCADDEYWDGTQCVKIRPYEQIFDTEGSVGGYNQATNSAYGLTNNYGYNDRRGFYTDATGKTIDVRTGQPAPAGYKAPKPTDYDSWYKTFNLDYGKDLEQFNPGIRTEAGDLLYNSGVDPRIYMLDQYMKTVDKDASGLPGRGAFRAANKAGVWTDPTQETAFNTIYDQYKDKISGLPVDQQRNLMNQGRQFYYENTNKGYWNETKDAQGNPIKNFVVDPNKATEMNPATESWFQRYGLSKYAGKFKNRQDPNASSAAVPTIAGTKDVNTNTVTTPAAPAPKKADEVPTTNIPVAPIQAPVTEPAKPIGATTPAISVDIPAAQTNTQTTVPKADVAPVQVAKTPRTDFTNNSDPNDPDYINPVSLNLSRKERLQEGAKSDATRDQNQNSPGTFFNQMGINTGKFDATVDAFKGMTDKLGVVGQFIGDRNKQKDYDKWARDQRYNSAAVVPANRSGVHGNWSVTGSDYGTFRSPEVGFSNEGRYMNNPGMKIRAFGGVIGEELNLPSDTIQITSVPEAAPSTEVNVPESVTTPPTNNTGVNPMAQKTWDDVSKTFKGVSNAGIWGDRSHKARKSDHNTGDALDIGINSITAGNQIAQKLINEAPDRNIKYLIFNRRIWNPQVGWQTYTPNKSNGNNPHTTHVHVSFSRPDNATMKEYATGGVIDESLELPSDVISEHLPLPQATPDTNSSSQTFQKSEVEEGPQPSSWEHYNPGNIHYSEFAKTYNAKIGRKDVGGRVAIFPDMNTGLQAMKDLIFGEGYKNLTVSQARNRWVTGKPDKFTPSTPNIVGAMGGDYKLKDLNEDERNKLMAEFIKWEDRKVYNKLKGEKLIFAEGGSVDEITCSNCGWSWKADDSDPSDVTTCHKCGFNNNTINNNMKIRITGGPKQMAYGGQSGYGFDLGQRNTYSAMSQNPYEESSKTLGPVPREEANVEAEEGETVYGDIDKDGQREHMVIGGKKHTQGGTPLNVPEGSFIFSDTKKMRIKDPEVLSFFSLKPIKEGYTPAEIAKRYDVNKYKAILQDPLADGIKKRTAQLMMENYEKKLGYLALIQESMKGFPQGLPKIAEEVLGTTKQGQQALQSQAPQQGGQEQMPQQGQAPMQEMPQQGPQEEMMEGPQGQNPEEEGMEEMPPMQMYGGSPYAYGGTYAFNDGAYIPQDYGEMAYGGYMPYADEGMETIDKRKKKKVKTNKGEVDAEVYDKGNIPKEYVPYPGSTDLWWIPGKPGSIQKGTMHKGRDVGGGGRPIKGCENLLYTVEDMKARPGCYKTFLEKENWKNAPPEEQAKGLKELVKGHRYSWQSPDTDIPGTDPQYATIEEEPVIEKTPEYKWQCTENGPIQVDMREADDGEGFSDPITHQWVTSSMMGYGDETKGGPYYDSYEEANKVCGKKTEKKKTTQTQLFPGVVPSFDSAAAVGPKKYHPWAARLEQYMPNPAFLSPERELAENAGLATSMTRGFTGSPQQYAAMANAAQTGAIGNAANIIGRVSNQNVGIANQFSPMQTGIMNEMMKYDANRQDTLHHNENMYDKEYRNTLRKYLTDRDKIKKGKYEYATKRNILNATNPYYNIIDTPQGGMVQFRPGVDSYNTVIGPNSGSGGGSTSYKQRLDEYKRSGQYTDPQIKLLLDQEFGTGGGSRKTSDVNAWNQAYMNNMRNNSVASDDEE